jgi:predicted ATPase/GAF domain-containing protein/tRNA A-37 threonylcarbamoyl transferase component Bud32
VVLWALQTAAARMSDIARLKHAYEAIQRVDAEGVVKVLAVDDTGDNIIIVLEDFPGVPLREVLRGRPRLDVGEALDIAVRLARAIADIHRASITHGDIRPQNILVAGDGRIKLTRFGAAHAVTREDEAIYDKEVIEDLLPYISPEQTGRMNRQVDYRTDLYSLGAVLYEVLTGTRPFAASDPLEIIHAHLALMPRPPAALEPSVPAALSEIVMRLLAKNAEDRYSAAEGLLYDLDACRRQWTEKGRVDPFAIGQHDRRDLFEIHQKLYGRERDIKALTQAFEDVLAGARKIVLVSGYSGIGKSSLVQEILKPLARERGYYISGKFDQYNRDTPYSALIQAFESLIQQILSESEPRIERWRGEVGRALGSNGQIVCDVIPSLRHLIGEQPPMPALGPVEAQNRFSLYFTKFVSVFARQAHPLALFIDDLQWVDPASLRLLQAILLEEGMESLFFCGAYRDNEVSPAHPFMRAVEELKKGGVEVAAIVLGPLAQEHLIELTADSLRTREVAPLAEIILHKTGGNPFFVKQFIRHLYDTGALHFEPAQGFRWDLDRISALQDTDNVVALMAQTIQRLPAPVQDTLKLAAAIGNRFDLRALATVSEASPTETYERLERALREGLVQSAGEVYRFTHDKIQEAAYSMIPVESRPAFHYRIGKLLLKDLDLAASSDLFDCVTHLNSAGDLASDPAERAALVELNLKAAERAEEAAAFKAALRYLEQGMARLPEDPWKSAYELTLDYYMRKGFMESLCERHDDALRTLSIAFESARGRVDKTEVRRRRIGVQVLKNDLLAALDEGLAVMRDFGIDLPPFPDDATLLSELEVTLSLIGEKTDEELLALPQQTDREIAALQEVLQELFTPCIFLGTNNFGITVMKILQNTLRHGISRSASYGFVNFGVVLCSRMDIDNGYRFGKLATELAARYPDKKSEAMLYCMWGGLTQHWKEPYAVYKETLRKGIHIGLETGQYIWAFYNTVNTITNSLLQGLPLTELLAEVNAYQHVSKLDKFNAIMWMVGSVAQIAHNLTTPVERPEKLKGAWIDVDAILEEARKIDNLVSIFFANFYSVVLGVFQGAYEETAGIADEMDPTVVGVSSWHGTSAHHFYAGVAFTRASEAAPPDRRAVYIKKARKSAEKLEEWAGYCPENMRHRWLLLAAELRRVDGDKTAGDAYDAGIAAAREGRFLHDEALGNELCARHYLALGKTTIARAYLAEAQALYARWGASEAVLRIARAFPDLAPALEPRRPAEQAKEAAEASPAAAPWAAPLDALSVLKVSQAISEELILSRLLERLMRIILENAGARRGFLVLKPDKSDARLVIEAEGDVDHASIDVLRSIPVDDCDRLSARVVHYAARTGESVVTADASSEDRFASDPYISKNGTRSLLATPILRRGEIAGVIYLENDLVTGAFTPQQIEVLRALSAQAAISIENATLYARLEERVNERTADLRRAHEQIMELNLEQQARQEQEMREKTELILRQEELIRALSTPIIQVWDDVLTIPVVGELDDRRSTDITQSLLERISSTRSRYAIVDLTGVREIDAATADRIARIVRAVKLLGARGIITGIRPAVAQVMTSLGADLSDVTTHRNLREGLRACMADRYRQAQRMLEGSDTPD